MKKLSKLLLVIMLLTFISPITQVYAEPEEAPEQTEEVVEETDEEANEEAPEETPEEADEEANLKVDEDNESPFLYEDEEDPDQSKRDKEIIKKPIETPASVTGEKYRGSGTVVDFTTTGAKAFYTVKAPDNSVFYIVIDMDKTEDNVYFMSEINGEELNLSDVTTKPNTPIQDENTPTKPKTEEKKTTSGNSLTFWLIIIVGGIGFIGYHFFFGKLKNLNPILNKDKEVNDELDDEHDIYNEEDLPEEEMEEFTVSDFDEEDDE